MEFPQLFTSASALLTKSKSEPAKRPAEDPAGPAAKIQKTDSSVAPTLYLPLIANCPVYKVTSGKFVHVIDALEPHVVLSQWDREGTQWSEKIRTQLVLSMQQIFMLTSLFMDGVTDSFVSC